MNSEILNYLLEEGPVFVVFTQFLSIENLIVLSKICRRYHQNEKIINIIGEFKKKHQEIKNNYYHQPKTHFYQTIFEESKIRFLLGKIYAEIILNPKISIGDMITIRDNNYVITKTELKRIIKCYRESTDPILNHSVIDVSIKEFSPNCHKCCDLCFSQRTLETEFYPQIIANANFEKKESHFEIDLGYKVKIRYQIKTHFDFPMMIELMKGKHKILIEKCDIDNNLVIY